MSDKVRSFIAVDPSPEVLSRITQWVQKMDNVARGFRWVQSQGLHLTLRFLGDMAPEDLSVLEGRLEQLASGILPISLTASGVGFFPNVSKPHVAWVGIGGEVRKLQELQTAVCARCEGLPVYQELKKTFSPHLTVARIPDFRRSSGAKKVLEAAPREGFGAFTVQSVILYKSTLTPQGSRYTKLKEFSLKRE